MVKKAIRDGSSVAGRRMNLYYQVLHVIQARLLAGKLGDGLEDGQ